MKNAKFAFFQRGKSIVFVKKLRLIQLLVLWKINQEKVSGDVPVIKKFICNPL